MELLQTGLIVKEIPLFSALTDDERAIIQERCSIVEYKKGQVIYREAAPADAFYCLVMGRVVIYTLDQEGKRTELEYLHRGKYFGIISLLTGEPHSVSAEAVNDCIILVMQKDDFSFILKRVPSLAIDLSQTLSRRLKNKDIHRKTIFESTIISVFSSYSQAGKTMYALNLALSLQRETHKSIVVLDVCPAEKIHTLPRKLETENHVAVFNLSKLPEGGLETVRDYIIHNRFGIDVICFWYEENGLCVKNLLGIVSLLVNDYHYLLLDLPTVMDQSVFNLLNQSEVITLLTSPDPLDLKKTYSLVEKLKKDFNFSPAKIKVIVNEYKSARLTSQEQVGVLDHEIFATLPKIEYPKSDRLVIDEPDSEYAKAVRRVARDVGDCLVGLALGVGVAYGFCHIGVLKVFEEEHISIDAISGSSIGAVIAGLWATGRSSQEILQITKEFREPKYIWGFIDLTIPFLGFIKGNKLYAFLKKYFGNKTFYDVTCPLKIVASDVKRKESRVINKGLLADAIMASCTMPGVFTPFKLKEEMLFDGGVITPLPTEVLYKMGVKKIIAVNVTPSREDALKQYEALREQIEMAKTSKERQAGMQKYLKGRLKTNILDIIFSSIEVLQSEVAKKEEQLADIVLHPDTSGLHWMELHKSEEFAERGEAETRRNLRRILQVINE